MAGGMQPELGPPPMELTPEILAAMLAMEKGLPPDAGPSPEQMMVPPPM